MAGWKTFIQSSLPAVLILFVGSWSDRHGRRKPCMLLPIVGELLTSIGLLVCTYFYYELPIEAATVGAGEGREGCTACNACTACTVPMAPWRSSSERRKAASFHAPQFSSAPSDSFPRRCSPP